MEVMELKQRPESTVRLIGKELLRQLEHDFFFSRLPTEFLSNTHIQTPALIVPPSVVGK